MLSNKFTKLQSLVVTMAIKKITSQLMFWNDFTVKKHLTNFYDDLQHRTLVGNFKLCLFVYYFSKHLLLSFWPGSHSLSRLMLIDYYYFTFGEPYFRTIEFLSVMPVGPLIFFVYNIFWKNKSKFAEYTTHLLERYTKRQSKSSLRLMLAELTAISISIVREIQLFYAFIVLCRQWNILVEGTNNPIQLIIMLWVLLFSFTLHMLCVRTFINLCVVVLLEILLYDQLIVNSLKLINRSLIHSNFYRQQNYCSFIRMLVFLDIYNCLFGRMFSIYLYMMLPNFSIMFLEVGRFEFLRQLLPVIISGMSFLAGLFVLYIFGVYVTLYHQSYLQLKTIQLDRLVLANRWKALKMIELLGGPNVGLRYYLLNNIITKRSLLNVCY